MPNEKNPNWGGARPGGGRKPMRDEDKIRESIAQAVREKWPEGGIAQGFRQLLDDPDSTLRKFAWSHIIGNPVDRKYIEMAGAGGGPIQTLDLSKYSPDQLRDMLNILNEPKGDEEDTNANE